MFLKKTKTNGKTYLQIVRKYRLDGKIKERVIEAIGYVEDLTSTYDDPIAHFQQRAKELTLLDNQQNTPYPLELDFKDKLQPKNNDLYNFGYVYLQKEYYTLGLDSFFNRKQESLDIAYNLNNIIRLLTYQRILHPASKKNSFENASTYFEKMAPSNIDAVYDALSRVSNWQHELQLHLHERVTSMFGQRSEIGYFDCTNYYFEIDAEDDLRRNGPSKEHRKTPIIQMGLLMDTNGIPMAYHLFPGNEAECVHLRPVINRCRMDYGLKRIVVVADKGLNTSDNIFYTHGKGDGYIYSQTITGSDAAYKDWALEAKDFQVIQNHEDNEYQIDENGEKNIRDAFKMKSRIIGNTIKIKDENGNRNKRVTIKQKQIVYYSPKYAKQCKALRNKVLEKARKVLNGEIAYASVSSYGVMGYIKEDVIDKNGELIKKADKKNMMRYLDTEKIEEQEKYDGLYSIVTSEVHLSDHEIIDTYRGLWKIEESFKITKSEFKSRPVYLKRPERIEAHFFTCFLSLLILRIMEYKMKREFSPHQLIESMKKHQCTHISENIYQFIYRDEVIEALDKLYRIQSDTKYMKRQDIKNILASVKK